MRKLINNIVFWGGFLVGARAAWRHFATLLGKVAGQLSSAETHPSASTTQFAEPVIKQYVVGDSVESALAAADNLHSRKIGSSLLQLGEGLRFSHEAVAQRDALLALIEQVGKRDADSSVSLKLSQLGYALNPTLALASLEAIVAAAAQHNVLVIIDTESAETVDATLSAFESVRRTGPIGIGLQAYLYRSYDDLQRVLQATCPIRLSIGSYAESADTALPSPEARAQNFLRLVTTALDAPNTHDVLIEAHDDALVQAVLDHVKANGTAKDKFCFEMVYGKRDDLQTHLADLDYRVQVYLPFGSAWYPYVMRRMVEQPKELSSFLGGL